MRCRFASGRQEVFGWYRALTRIDLGACARSPRISTRVGHTIGPVSQPLAIRRSSALDGDGLHHLLLIAALHRHFLQLTASVFGDFARRGEQHALAVRTPAGDDVGRRMPGQPARLAAARRSDTLPKDGIPFRFVGVAGRPKAGSAFRRANGGYGKRNSAN
jgi:hypothetical protein